MSTITYLALFQLLGKACMRFLINVAWRALFFVDFVLVSRWYRRQVIVEKGRVRGAMLIGDTGMEETFENLILNGTDVSDIGADLLSVDVDIEDFFD